MLDESGCDTAVLIEHGGGADLSFREVYLEG